jgi:hypothetical protein
MIAGQRWIETIMDTMHNFEASTEVREFKDELSEEGLTKASGGYIGETEKYVSSGAARLQVKDSHDRYA